MIKGSYFDTVMHIPSLEAILQAAKNLRITWVRYACAGAIQIRASSEHERSSCRDLRILSAISSTAYMLAIRRKQQ